MAGYGRVLEYCDGKIDLGASQTRGERNMAINRGILTTCESQVARRNGHCWMEQYQVYPPDCRGKECTRSIKMEIRD